MTETDLTNPTTGASTGIEVPPRSPARAAAYSWFWIGAGQVYNKQLEKAVLLWIWSAIVAGAGAILLLMALLARVLPAGVVRPPLGDWVLAHGGAAAFVWVVTALVVWGIGVRDAYLSAERINRGEIVIRYPMRRQMVHVLASQLLGFVPFVGLFFPPAVVAEAIDAAGERRGPDRSRLLREGGQALLEWAATRIAVYAAWLFLAVWLLWWLLRGLRLVP